jgi:hypothetical protein
MVVQQVAVDATLVRNAVVLLGLLAVFVYILVSYSRWLVIVPLLVGLAGLFFAQQFAFSALVLPELRRTLPTPAVDTVVRVQTVFEVAFTLKILIIFLELAVEKLFTGDEPLRTLGDGLLGSVNVAVLLVALAVVSVVSVGSEVVLSVLSAVFALRLVETVVDFAIALAEDT